MYFVGNVRFETQGLLSPRASKEGVPRLQALEFLRFLAAMHLVMFWRYYPTKHKDSWILKVLSNAKGWGFTAPAFFFLLSGFVLTYNYAPTLTEGRIGFSVKDFFFKRLCWLYPLYLISLLLPLWATPLSYLSTTHEVLKFVVNLLGLSAWWPPSFRTYDINEAAWMASVFMFFYVVMFPLFLRSIHLSLSRVARMWLLVFVWPWTWFIGWSIQRFDDLTDDDRKHWDWYNPVIYAPVFLMGMLAGSIFAHRDAESEGVWVVLDRFAGMIGFAGLCAVYLFADAKPMYNWHRAGSLALLQLVVVYFFAQGKDVLGTIFSLFPFRFLGGFGFAIVMLQHAVFKFSKQIDTVRDELSFFISLAAFCTLGRFLVEIPYARWSLRVFQDMQDSREKVEPSGEAEGGNAGGGSSTPRVPA